jgi:hypothetical protein
MLMITKDHTIPTWCAYVQSFYPTANLGKIIARSPKYLLQNVQSLKEDAIQVTNWGAGCYSCC